MSWDISLEDAETGKVAEVENHSEGGTYALGGTKEAELNVTYNYSKHFSFKVLNHQLAQHTIPLLQQKVDALCVERDSDYWLATEGNVGYACSILLGWAKQYPDYIWRVE